MKARTYNLYVQIGSYVTFILESTTTILILLVLASVGNALKAINPLFAYLFAGIVAISVIWYLKTKLDDEVDRQAEEFYSHTHTHTHTHIRRQT